MKRRISGEKYMKTLCQYKVCICSKYSAVTTRWHFGPEKLGTPRFQITCYRQQETAGNGITYLIRLIIYYPLSCISKTSLAQDTFTCKFINLLYLTITCDSSTLYSVGRGLSCSQHLPKSFPHFKMKDKCRPVHRL